MNNITLNQNLNIMTQDGYALQAQLGNPVYLTPDAVMAYCESRLRGVDTQVEQAFQTQESANSDSQILTQLANNITLPTDDSIDMSKNPTLSNGQAASDWLKSVAAAYQEAANGVSDPQLKMALQAQGNKILGDANSATVTLNQSDLQSLITTPVSQFQQNLNSGSELSMMNLQSLMSQRQEAIQTCTNLVQAMGDMCSKITENIGK
jgi:hypothetical protein